MSKRPNEGAVLSVYKLIGNGKVVDRQKFDTIKRDYHAMEKWINNNKCNGKTVSIDTNSGSNYDDLTLYNSKIGAYLEGVKDGLEEECKGITADQSRKFLNNMKNSFTNCLSGVVVTEVQNISENEQKCCLAKMAVGFKKNMKEDTCDVAKVSYSQVKIIQSPGYRWATENWKTDKQQEKINNWLSFKLLIRLNKEGYSSGLALE